MMRLKQKKHLQIAEYWILKNHTKSSKFCLTASLPDHIHPNDALYSLHFMPQQQTHQWDVPFWGFDECGDSASFYFPLGSSSSSSGETISMC